MTFQKGENVSQIPPIALFAFNRPEFVRDVFARVREARPAQLFLCMDGPRPGRADDSARCAEVRQILAGVDWPCEVRRNYAEENLGCRRRMGSGISWVFEQVEEAILLEDDCVPHPDFFRFSAELLDRYRHDTRIGMIAGHIEHFKPINKAESYYFDRFPTIIGWATWRRAWQCFDAELREWPRLRETSFLRTLFPTERAARHVASFFEGVYAGRANSWATVWWFSMLRNNLLCVHPSVNLITNVGVYGVHNRGPSEWHGVPSAGIAFPLSHPCDVIPDADEERRMRDVYAPPGRVRCALSQVKGLLLNKGR